MNKPTIVTKAKIASHLSQKLGFSRNLCNEITSTIFNEIINLTVLNKKLTIYNFGSWKISYKKERPGFNMHNHQAVTIKPRRILVFSPAQSFKDKVNHSD